MFELPIQQTQSPVVRSCRTVIEHAGEVAELLVADDFAQQLQQLDPRLRAPLQNLADAVYDLDYRTGYLDRDALPQAL